MKKRYRLIASDCDGTLINSDHELTERTKTAIDRCMDAGAVFVLATGRPTYAVQWFVDMFDRDMPIVTYNGSFAMMSKTQKILLEVTLPAELCREAITLGRERGMGVITYVDHKLYVAERNAWTDDYARFFNVGAAVTENISDVVKNGASKVLWIKDAGSISDIYAETQTRFAGRLNCFTSTPFLFEFISTGASKGAAIKKIGGLYGIGPEEMIAVGDGFNDVDMIEYAGLGIAVKNAPKGVKDAADEIAPSNDDDGVAAVIEKYILKK
ncbi:MAG: Cof-type HAD-IIB family hydrolase [Oscillospiraceae bacterium]|nr:Cof-type HAD-IIB family hydrolase [Oscillospiraceae bacterium]